MSRRRAPRKPQSTIRENLEVPPLSPLPPPTAPIPLVWRWIAVLLVCAYVGLSLGHLNTTPVLPADAGSFINAPDEAAHLGYVRILVEERRLPTRDDSSHTYEWHQPPLYYSLAALAYAGGPKAVRCVSLAFGALSLGAIFLAARRLFPNDPVLAVLALGLAALLPMREAVYASAGNDSLTELLFSLALLQIIGTFTHGFTLRRAGMMGVTLGAAVLTKATGMLLVPVLVFAVVLLVRGGEGPKTAISGGLYALLVAVSLTGFWFLRNLRLYGELTPVKAFLHEFENTSRAANWIGQPMAADLWTGALGQGPPMSRAGYLGLVANWTFRSFFAAYTTLRGAANGIPKFLDPAFYLPGAALGLASFAGLVRLHFRRNADFTAVQRSVVLVFWVTIFLVAASFAGFIWTFFQAQGRYLYPAMLPLSILAALGFRAVLPERYRDLGSGLLLALMLALSLAFLLVGVLPAYKT